MSFSLIATALITATLTASPPAPPSLAPGAAVFMPGDAEAKAFKESFERGEALFQQADFGAAIANFRAADRVRVTPEVAYDLAKCHERLGDQAFAIFYYRLYMKRAPSAPDTLDVAERVGTVLAKVEAEGRGFLELDVPRGTNVAVAGKTWAEGPVAAFLAPGEYEVSADFPTGRRTMSVQVKTGKTSTVHFEPMQPALVSVDHALSAEAIAAGQTEPKSQVSGLRLGSYVVAGVGVAALVTGLILGVLAGGDAAHLTDKSLTYSQALGYANAANTKGLVANVLFGVGGAAVAGGVLMWVFSMPEPGQKAKP